MYESSEQPASKADDVRSLSAEFFPRIAMISSDGSIVAQGTGTFIGMNLVLTAKHLIEDYFALERVSPFVEEISSFRIWVIQIVFSDSDFEYRVWEAQQIAFCSFSDLALLHLRPRNQEAGKAFGERRVRHLALDFRVPAVGDRITAFGYTRSQSQSTIDPDGTIHHAVNDTPRVSVGSVVEVYPRQRDARMLTFPSFQTDTQFDGGMSGGPILNASGFVSGVVCSGFELHDQGRQISFAASIWPIAGALLTAMEGGPLPVGTGFLFFKLFADGRFSAQHLDDVRVTLSDQHLVTVRYQDSIELQGSLRA